MQTDAFSLTQDSPSTLRYLTRRLEWISLSLFSPPMFIDSTGYAIAASDWLHGKLASPIFFSCLVLRSDCMHVRHRQRISVPHTTEAARSCLYTDGWKCAVCVLVCTKNTREFKGADGTREHKNVLCSENRKRSVKNAFERIRAIDKLHSINRFV